MNVELRNLGEFLPLLGELQAKSPLYLITDSLNVDEMASDRATRQAAFPLSPKTWLLLLGEDYGK